MSKRFYITNKPCRLGQFLAPCKKMDSVEASFLRRRAKDHLLHLNVARKFIQQVTGGCVPDDILQFQERLRNGVYLAQLARALSRESGFLVFDEDQGIYEKHGFHFKHINNIQMFLKYLRHVSLPAIFHPEIPDIYEKKNIPKLLYCLRALIHHIGFDLKIDINTAFSEDIINQVSSDFAKKTDDNSEFVLQKFENTLLNSDFDEFYELVKNYVVKKLGLKGINVREISLLYFEEVREARRVKGKPLTINEIVEVIKRQTEVYRVTLATILQDSQFLLETLTYDADLAKDVKPGNVTLYMLHLAFTLKVKKENSIANYLLTHADIVDAIQQANGLKKTAC